MTFLTLRIIKKSKCIQKHSIFLIQNFMGLCYDLLPWISIRQIEYHTIFNQINLNKMFYNATYPRICSNLFEMIFY